MIVATIRIFPSTTEPEWYLTIGEDLYGPFHTEAEAATQIPTALGYAGIGTFLIRSTDEEGLFWSNHLGWTTFTNADRFSLTETTTLHLPLGGTWHRIA